MEQASVKQVSGDTSENIKPVTNTKMNPTQKKSFCQVHCRPVNLQQELTSAPAYDATFKALHITQFEELTA